MLGGELSRRWRICRAACSSFFLFLVLDLDRGCGRKRGS